MAKKCVICKNPYQGYGNNAEPAVKGYCCDPCNMKFVIPYRLSAMFMGNKFKDYEFQNSIYQHMKGATADELNRQLDLVMTAKRHFNWSKDFYFKEKGRLRAKIRRSK